MRILFIAPSLMGMGIRSILERDDTVQIFCISSTDPEVVLIQVQHFAPDLTILDAVSIKPLPFLEALGLKQVKQLGILVVALEAAPKEETFFQLLRWGVCACLFGSDSLEAACETIRRVASGECLMTGALLRGPSHTRPTSTVAARIRSLMLATPPSPLTTREKDVLERLALGHSNKEIARHLGLREQTVKNVVASVFDKVGIRDRTAVVVVALLHGWITLPADCPSDGTCSEVAAVPRSLLPDAPPLPALVG